MRAIRGLPRSSDCRGTGLSRLYRGISKTAVPYRDDDDDDDLTRVYLHTNAKKNLPANAKLQDNPSTAKLIAMILIMVVENFFLKNVICRRKKYLTASATASIEQYNIMTSSDGRALNA